MDLILDDEKIEALMRSPDLTLNQKLSLLSYRAMASKNDHIEEAEIVSESPRERLRVVTK